MKEDKLPELPPIERLVKALDRRDSIAKPAKGSRDIKSVYRRETCPILRRGLIRERYGGEKSASTPGYWGWMFKDKHEFNERMCQVKDGECEILVSKSGVKCRFCESGSCSVVRDTQYIYVHDYLKQDSYPCPYKSLSKELK